MVAVVKGDHEVPQEGVSEDVEGLGVSNRGDCNGTGITLAENVALWRNCERGVVELEREGLHRRDDVGAWLGNSVAIAEHPRASYAWDT